MKQKITKFAAERASRLADERAEVLTQKWQEQNPSPIAELTLADKLDIIRRDPAVIPNLLKAIVDGDGGLENYPHVEPCKLSPMLAVAIAKAEKANKAWKQRRDDYRAKAKLKGYALVDECILRNLDGQQLFQHVTTFG